MKVGPTVFTAVNYSYKCVQAPRVQHIGIVLKLMLMLLKLGKDAESCT